MRFARRAYWILANVRPGSFRSAGGTALRTAALAARAQLRIERQPAPKHRDQRARGARRGSEGACVEQAVGAILVVGLGERGAEFPNDDALGEGVESPSRHNARMISAASSARPAAMAARAAAIIPALDCGGAAAKYAATFAGASACAASSASCRSKSTRCLANSDGPQRRRRAMQGTDARPPATPPIPAPIAARDRRRLASAFKPAASPLL